MTTSAVRTLDDYYVEPTPVLDSREAEHFVDLSIRTGWVGDAEKRLASITDPTKFLMLVTRTVDEATVAIEQSQFPIADGIADLAAARDLNVDYFNAPVIAARTTDATLTGPLAAANLQDIYCDQLGFIKRGSLIVPSNRDDIEQIGTQADFLSMLFWAEIQSINARQRPWTLRAQYDNWIAKESASAQDRYRLIVDELGYEIHGITAMSDKCRARYFVHVPEERARAFLEAIGEDQAPIVDLENFGVVVSSFFLSKFRERQTSLARDAFADIVKRYVELAVRERNYSYGDIEAAKSFQEKRFARAMIDPQSRSALLDELANQVEVQEEIATAEPVTEKPILFSKRLSPSASSKFFEIVNDRGLAIEHMMFMAQLAIAPTLQSVGALVEQLCEVSRRLGGGSTGVDRMLLLIAQHRGLTSPDLLANAVRLATPNDGKEPPSGIGRLLSRRGGAPAGSANAAIMVDWEALRACFAALDYWLAVSDAPDALIAVIQQQSQAETPDTQNLLAYVETLADSHSVEKTVVSGADAIAASGIALERNIAQRTLRLSLSKNLHEEDRAFLGEYFTINFIDKLKSLTIIGRYIESKPYSEKRDFLAKLLTTSLQPAFEKSAYPDTKRAELIERWVDELLVHDRQPRVEGDQAEPDIKQSPLPTHPPKKWPQDREGKETPPEFIGKHYADWLGKGLTRSDLKSIDKELWQALTNWLRTNAMPEDIDLPTRTEQNTRWLDRVKREGFGMIANDEPGYAAKEAKRLLELDRHRTRREKGKSL